MGMPSERVDGMRATSNRVRTSGDLGREDLSVMGHKNIVVISVDIRETRVALIEEGIIAELHIERRAHGNKGTEIKQERSATSSSESHARLAGTSSCLHRRRTRTRCVFARRRFDPPRRLRGLSRRRKKAGITRQRRSGSRSHRRRRARPGSRSRGHRRAARSTVSIPPSAPASGDVASEASGDISGDDVSGGSSAESSSSDDGDDEDDDEGEEASWDEPASQGPDAIAQAPAEGSIEAEVAEAARSVHAIREPAAELVSGIESPMSEEPATLPKGAIAPLSEPLREPLGEPEASGEFSMNESPTSVGEATTPVVPAVAPIAPFPETGGAAPIAARDAGRGCGRGRGRGRDQSGESQEAKPPSNDLDDFQAARIFHQRSERSDAARAFASALIARRRTRSRTTRTWSRKRPQFREGGGGGGGGGGGQRSDRGGNRGGGGGGHRSGGGRDHGPMAGRIWKSTPIREVVKEGQGNHRSDFQDPIGTKGARCTSHVSLAGRYVVYLPTVEHIGISKRIGSERERARLREPSKASNRKPAGSSFAPSPKA